MNDLWWRLLDALKARLLSAEQWLLGPRHGLWGAAACRIGTALAVLGLLVSNFSSRQVWVGEASVWAEPAKRLSQFPEVAILTDVSGDVLTLVYGLTMLSALALALGWHTKAATLVTLVGFIAVVAQDPVVGDEGDNLLRITLLWLMLVRTSDRWSLDQRRRDRAAEAGTDEEGAGRFDGDQVLPEWLSTGLHHVGLIGLMTQSVLLFTAAGLDKVSQDVWQDGTALYYTMQLPEFRPFPGLSDAVSSSSVVLALLTYAVLLTQLFFAPLLLNPVSRRLVISAALVVNVVLAVLLAVPWSSLAYVAVTCLFVSSASYERLDERLRDRLAPAADWLALRGYDVQDGAYAVLDRTVYPVVDRVRATLRR